MRLSTKFYIARILYRVARETGSPRLAASSASIITTAAAPSESCEALPAVVGPRIGMETNDCAFDLVL